MITFSKTDEKHFADIFGGYDDNKARAEVYENQRNRPYKLDVDVNGKQKVISGTSYRNCIRQANQLGEWTLNGAWKE